MDDDKKDRILEIAGEMFARYGFKKASITEIATESGVGKGTIYLGFQSKEDLFYQVVHREVRAWTAAVATRIDPRKPADELLVSILLAMSEIVSRRPILTELLLGRLDRLLPVWARELADLRALGRGSLVEVVKLGVRQGVFREDIEPDEVASVVQDLLVAGLVAAQSQSRTDEQQLRLKLIGLDLVLNGLVNRAE